MLRYSNLPRHVFGLTPCLQLLQRPIIWASVCRLSTYTLPLSFAEIILSFVPREGIGSQRYGDNWNLSVMRNIAQCDWRLRGICQNCARQLLVVFTVALCGASVNYLT